MNMNRAIIAVAAVVLTVAMVRPAAAQLYPYCAWYTDKSTNCGFPTMGACQASVSGVGGYCGVNPRWAARRGPGYGAPPPPRGPGWGPPPLGRY